MTFSVSASCEPDGSSIASSYARDAFTAQRGLLTLPLSGLQWLAALGLALVTPIVIEVDKLIRRLRRRTPHAAFDIKDFKTSEAASSCS